jgi:hypothetical protein
MSFSAFSLIQPEGLTQESRPPPLPEILRYAQNDRMGILDSSPDCIGAGMTTRITDCFAPLTMTALHTLK